MDRKVTFLNINTNANVDRSDQPATNLLNSKNKQNCTTNISNSKTFSNDNQHGNSNNLSEILQNNDPKKNLNEDFNDNNPNPQNFQKNNTKSYLNNDKTDDSSIFFKNILSNDNDNDNNNNSSEKPNSFQVNFPENYFSSNYQSEIINDSANNDTKKDQNYSKNKKQSQRTLKYYKMKLQSVITEELSDIPKEKIQINTDFNTDLILTKVDSKITDSYTKKDKKDPEFSSEEEEEEEEEEESTNSTKKSRFSFGQISTEKRPNIDSNSDNVKINKFMKLLNDNDRECGIFLFNFTNYSKGENENGCVNFERNFQLSIEVPSSSSPTTKIPRTTSLKTSRNPLTTSLMSKSMSNEIYRKNMSFESDIKLKQLKQIYLAHLYKVSPTKFNEQYFLDQVTCYMRNQNNSLAHFQGFSIKNFEGHFLPTALTERPVNGPLSSLFSTIELYQSKNKLDIKKRRMIFTNTFNLDKIESVTAEQKFLIIIGIIHGIAFIHKNNFIHSNLNPTTVYLNEKLQPLICDYIFIPPFKITTNPKENPSNMYEKFTFEYSFDPEEPKIKFDNIKYVAPEILEGKDFDNSADIYSFGRIVEFILSEEETPNEVKYSDKWKDLIDRCTNTDPKERPTAIFILSNLLNEENMKEYMSATIPDSTIQDISEQGELYIKLIKENVEKDFDDDLIDIDIFHKMIPNVIGLDEETRFIIFTAEKGDAKSIEKVGDWFFTGENNFYRDNEWSYTCYKTAADKGSLYSIIKVAKFNEEGIGTDMDLNVAYEYYKKAFEMMKDDDPRKPDIEKKKNDLSFKCKSIVLTNVPLTKTISSLKRFFKGTNIDSIDCQKGENSQQVIIRFCEDKDVEQAVKTIRDKRQFQPYEYELLSYKHIKSHRFDSLSTDVPIINLDDYYPGKGNETFISLGKGAFAETFLVYKKGTEEQFAAKVFIQPITESQINTFKREIIMASKFNHPAILKYIGFNENNLIDHFNGITTNEVKPTLLLSYIPGGNLKKMIISKSSKWDNTAKLKAIIGIASGLSDMYVHNIIHRDLKPENILLNKELEPVICDLGCSRQYSSIDNLKMSDNVGTPIYMAPELFNANYALIYKYEVDSYSFGIILYQILTSTPDKKVYPSDASSKITLKRYKMNGYLPKLPAKMNNVFKYLIKFTWNISADERLSPPDIYSILLSAIDNSEPLLPDVDMDAVREYISRLPEI